MGGGAAIHFGLTIVHGSSVDPGPVSNQKSDDFNSLWGPHRPGTRVQLSERQDGGKIFILICLSSASPCRNLAISRLSARTLHGKRLEGHSMCGRALDAVSSLRSHGNFVWRFETDVLVHSRVASMMYLRDRAARQQDQLS
jgi:hypothetical protein